MPKVDTKFMPASEATGFIIIMGGPIDGFEFFGPFNSMQEAIAWFQRMKKDGHINTTNTWFRELSKPGT
jgi:hypothetical protein